MAKLVAKAFWLLRHRPSQFARTLRQYFWFALVGALRGLVYGRGSGIELGENVRIQTFTGLRAERPSARVRIGAHSIVYENAVIEAAGQGSIEIGECSVLGDIRMFSRGRIRLGARLLTSRNVFIQDFDPHPVQAELRAVQVRNLCAEFRPSSGGLAPEKLDWRFSVAEIEIGDDVWLGTNTTVLKGARIGDGCIVAAGAVVTAGDYPARSLLAGSPAKVVKAL